MAAGDNERNRRFLSLANELDIKYAATGNIHYHIRERHQLQDCLVAIRHCKSLEETHRERRPNSEFYLRPTSELAEDFPCMSRGTGKYAGDSGMLHAGPDARP